MDLVSPDPFWPIKNGLLATYPSLAEDVACDVAILGAGVTGSLVADALSEAGVRVVVLDRREVAHGSTSASTCLLQYEIDTSLAELIERHGKDHAVRAYRLCAAAIDRLDDITSRLSDRCSFARRPSCYLASRKKDAAKLIRECHLRRQHGFDVHYLNEREVDERFPFSALGALWSTCGGEIDAYRLTYGLLERAASRGAKIFDRTDVSSLAHSGDGWILKTERGPRVRARSLVMAAGYEAHEHLKPKGVSLHSSFAASSQPLSSFDGWPDRCLLWETARPYFYLRSTDEGRAIIGGEDEKFRNPPARDALVAKKSRALQKRFTKLFPTIPFEVEYAWAGTFAETNDGLAYIGQVAGWPHAWFALGYGGNGITYSVIAADIIRDAILGRANADAAIFRFDRP